MGLRDSRLDRYRGAVADNSTGRALHDLLNQLSAAFPDVEVTEPARKHVPAPYPHDHPAATSCAATASTPQSGERTPGRLLGSLLLRDRR